MPPQIQNINNTPLTASEFASIAYDDGALSGTSNKEIDGNNIHFCCANCNKTVSLLSILVGSSEAHESSNGAYLCSTRCCHEYSIKSTRNSL